MLARSGMRSSALARAQVQLSGQRVPVKPRDSADELQEYMHALNKKTSTLKRSQPATADLSDLSASEQDSAKHKGTVSALQSTGTKSRFLKKKANEDMESHVKPIIEVTKPSHPQPVQSKTPTSAALSKLAEFENRHRLRKLEIDMSENDSDLRTSEERPFSNRSSSDFSTRGNSFLKKKVNIQEPKPVEKSSTSEIRGKSIEIKRRVESDEEEIGHLVGSSVEFSENDDRSWKIPKPPRTPSPLSKSTPRRNLHRSPSALGFISSRRPPSRFLFRTPSPPSHGTPRYPRRTHSLTRFGSRSPSPSVKSSLTDSSPRARLGRRSKTPLSQRSDLKSLDELFSRADDLSSSSSIDFKLNILSLDELEPVADKYESGEKTVYEKAKKSTTCHEELSHKKNGKAFVRQKSSSDEESALEVHTETNKSEVSKTDNKDQFSSSEDYLLEGPDEGAAYSEDFEESVLSDSLQTGKFDSYSQSISSNESSLSSSHSYQQPIQRKKKKHHKIQQVIVRETSVQTNDTELTFRWPQATIGLGNAASITVEPSSVLSHMVSPELIEALTTYSPMALALNDMLKQQLLLTQAFVEMTRQLYLSTVRSLEGESYQYTTLEDTKEYIRQQKYLKWKHSQKVKVSGTHTSEEDRELRYQMADWKKRSRN